MSTYVLMRILESAPESYDAGIRFLSLGAVGKAYDRLASHIRTGQKVLDIGCGTGELAIRAARCGAKVLGMDINPGMLEIAGRKARQAKVADRISFVEQGVAELDGEETGSYHAVTIGLCLSELNEDELRYTLNHVARLLKPGGLLLIGDEVRPSNRLARLAVQLVRLPLAVIASWITRRTTRPLARLEAGLERVGLDVLSTKSSRLGGFCELVAQKPGASP